MFNKLFNTAHLKLTKSIDQNISLFQKIFSHDRTIIFRHFKAGYKNIKCCLIYVDEMADREIINENIMQPVMYLDEYENIPQSKILDFIVNKVLISGNVKKSSDISCLAEAILYGDTMLLVDGFSEILIIDTKGWKVRSITPPETEKVVRGAREGFTESIIINLSLIRRKLLTTDLKFEFKQLGTRTKTTICICYIEGLAPAKIINELEKRLDNINIDGVLDSGYIEELIKDSPLSPFKTIGSTERPDTVAGKLLEGRVAVVCDGSPFVLTLPHIFIEAFQVNEDYYNNFIFASINRMLRYFSFFLTISVPSIFLALTTYHQEMIPTPLLLSIAASREGVPFPTVVEAAAMLVTFEMLREAGVRLATPIGQTVSIVGALVLGEAAVTAKFASAPMIIVVALTGITSYLITEMLGALILVRIILLLLSSVLGLYGYIFGVIGLFIHLMSMRSFGVPYMLNVSSINVRDLKDTAVRAPWYAMYFRPKLMTKNMLRKSGPRLIERR
ncbi:spore germination protein KA [Desulfohalotomaculum tongense]|uniref:spore germination protein n=1 Tax=Desulforadius tongensis TaxID=1216062 RepID=UPI00195943E1|nr:spore germination protein [Desulforadius tongensis]MBM7855094.1 spore germination protein KA [Desulforadius tongensis]